MVVVNQVENVSVMQRSCMKARYAKHPFITTTASLPFLSRITGTEGGGDEAVLPQPRSGPFTLSCSTGVVSPDTFQFPTIILNPTIGLWNVAYVPCMVEMYRFDFLHGWGTAALLAFFTYIYEIWYTCVSYEDLQKSLLGPWSKPNRKSDIWNLVAFFLRLTCSIMLSLLRHFFSTWHRKSDEILMFFRLLYFQYCDNFVCGP